VTIAQMDRRLGVLARQIAAMSGPKFPGTPEYEKYQRLVYDQRNLSARMVQAIGRQREDSTPPARFSTSRAGRPHWYVRTLAGSKEA